MKHPIYSYIKGFECDIFNKVINGELEYDEIQGEITKGLCDMFNSKTVAYSDKDKHNIEFLSFLTIGTAVVIKETGHAHIDASIDKWDSKISTETIKKMKFNNFRTPFKYGTIDILGNIYMFSFSENRMLIKILHDRKLEKNIGSFFSRSSVTKETFVKDLKSFTDEYADEDIDSTMVNLVSENDSDTIGDVVSRTEGFTENECRLLCGVLSVFMFITLKNDDKDLVKKKLVKNKGSKKRGIPKHTSNIIKIAQGLKYESSRCGDGKKTDRSWVVRGHWRNQFYSTLEEHKPKWIEPYFKGDKKKEIEKIYKV